MTREITNQTIVRLPAGAADSPALRLFSAPLFTIDRAVFRVELLWWLAVVVVASWVLLRTRFGNWIFAVGGSAQASRYVGVPVSRVKIILFMTTAAAAALYSCIVVPAGGQRQRQRRHRQGVPGHHHRRRRAARCSPAATAPSSAPPSAP